MTARGSIVRAAAAALVVLATAGCGRKAGTLTPYPPITDPVVFEDAFGDHVDFEAFRGSKVDAVSIDTNEKHQGTSSLKVTVPAPGDPTGIYAGGAFTTGRERDLSANNALTFWAKARVAATLDLAGFGNDNSGASRFDASWSAIPLTTEWRQYVIPIPLPAKLNHEGGLFYFAEGPENGQPNTLWFDDIRFATVSTISNPRPSMTSQFVNAFVGATVAIQGTKVVFNVAGTDETINHQPGYFTLSSSADSVATISASSIRVVGPGVAAITAKLGAVSATGTVTLSATAPPTSPAPTPTLPAGDVISLYSNAYTNVPVNTWSASWDIADLTDIKISGNDTKVYTGMGYAGVEFPAIDATAMTYFHIDVWVPVGTAFKVKLVDFGANGVYGGGDDREHELLFNAGTTPAMIPGTWSSLDIPLANFSNLTSRAHLAQLILSGAGTAFVDNILFHR
jgi:hypothetical protein